MVKLKIDPEFRDKIPPLTEAEFEQLKENILSDGEVYEPIVTWNDTIIDGHNRWRIICENWELLKDKFHTKPMNFADKYEAYAWMCKKQLGRRNLSPKDRDMLIDSMVEARKKSRGGQAGNENAAKEKRIDQSGQIVSSTRSAIAKELGVGEGTVQRAQQFGNGIREMEKVCPEAAEIIRTTDNVPRQMVRDIPKMAHEQIAELAQDILTGDIKKDRPKREKPNKEDLAAIGKIVDEMYDASHVAEYTMDMLVEDIQINGKMVVDMLRGILTSHSTLLTAENKPAVGEAIEKYFIEEIKKVKELVAK